MRVFVGVVLLMMVSACASVKPLVLRDVGMAKTIVGFDVRNYFEPPGLLLTSLDPAVYKSVLPHATWLNTARNAGQLEAFEAEITSAGGEWPWAREHVVLTNPLGDFAKVVFTLKMSPGHLAPFPTPARYQIEAFALWLKQPIPNPEAAIAALGWALLPQKLGGVILGREHQGFAYAVERNDKDARGSFYALIDFIGGQRQLVGVVRGEPMFVQQSMSRGSECSSLKGHLNSLQKPADVRSFLYTLAIHSAARRLATPEVQAACFAASEPAITTLLEARLKSWFEAFEAAPFEEEVRHFSMLEAAVFAARYDDAFTERSQRVAAYRDQLGKTLAQRATAAQQAELFATAAGLWLQVHQISGGADSLQKSKELAQAELAKVLPLVKGPTEVDAALAALYTGDALVTLPPLLKSLLTDRDGWSTKATTKATLTLGPIDVRKLAVTEVDGEQTLTWKEPQFKSGAQQAAFAAAKARAQQKRAQADGVSDGSSERERTTTGSETRREAVHNGKDAAQYGNVRYKVTTTETVIEQDAEQKRRYDIAQAQASSAEAMMKELDGDVWRYTTWAPRHAQLAVKLQKWDAELAREVTLSGGGLSLRTSQVWRYQQSHPRHAGMMVAHVVPQDAWMKPEEIQAMGTLSMRRNVETVALQLVRDHLERAVAGRQVAAVTEQALKTEKAWLNWLLGRPADATQPPLPLVDAISMRTADTLLGK